MIAGFLPDLPDTRDRVLMGSTRDLPDAAALPWRDGYLLPQGAAATCVPNAVLLALRLAALGAGETLPPLSRLWLYYWGRALDGIEREDGGSRIRTVLKALRRWGAPLETLHPYELARVNERPPWMLHREAQDFRRVGFYRVQTLAQLRRAITRGLAVVGGWMIGEEFTRADGPHYVESMGAPEGGHAMTITAYNGNHVRLVTWDRGWRDGGGVWIPAEVAMQAKALWAISY